MLDGEWRLVYTANSELMPLLALGRLPFVRIGDIVQAIDIASMTVRNKIAIESPLASGTLGANATFEVRALKVGGRPRGDHRAREGGHPSMCEGCPWPFVP